MPVCAHRPNLNPKKLDTLHLHFNVIALKKKIFDPECNLLVIRVIHPASKRRWLVQRFDPDEKTAH